MADGPRAGILPVVAGLVGLGAGWGVTHLVLGMAEYDGDPSRGAAYTGAAICGVAAAAATRWLLAARRHEDG